MELDYRDSLRERLDAAGVAQWQLARRLGFDETVFSRILREPICREQLAFCESAIQAIKREQEVCEGDRPKAQIN